jgi:glycosyltransferase involved in cell wall biosynthesis
MRLGQNPLKETEDSINAPRAITVGVLNFIPDQVGYFQGQFDSLKLCLSSIRAHAELPFNLLVVDNGSCLPVRSYLTAELEAGRIDHLILNQNNIGKANAQLQILRAAQGDLVFYSDGDIYYRSGWMKPHLAILEAFPEAGMVGGIPLRNQADFHTETTRRWAEKQSEGMRVEKGNLIPDEWTREFLRSVGDERFIENWIRNEDWRISRQSITAYVGASHMQFLIPRSAIEAIPPKRFTKALSTDDDQHLDNSLEKSGFLRLSVDVPLVYHIGNTISEPWLVDEYERLMNHCPADVQLAQGRLSPGRQVHWFWGRWRVLRCLKALYLWAFKKFYENA